MLNPSDGEVSRGEHVEAELRAHVAKAHERREAAGEPRSAQMLWEQSSQHYDAARLATMRAAWAEFHYEMADRHRATLGLLVEYHLRRAEYFEAAS
jgi:hypothetical protein